MSKAAPNFGFDVPIFSLDMGTDINEALKAAGNDAVLVDSLAAPAVAEWSGFKKAAVIHQQPGGVDEDPSPDLKAYERMELLIVASEALVGDLEGSGLSRRVMRAVPPGIDPEGLGVPTWSVQRRRELRAEMRAGRRAALLCVANWHPHKGVHTAFDVLDLLPPGSATLHLAGDAHADEGYFASLSPRIDERATLHGVVDVGRLVELYLGADIFILPSTQDAYATAVGEAMAYGLPVVGWSAGNLPNLAADGIEGFVVASGDVAGLAGKVGDLIEDPELAENMGGSAYTRASTRPTWDQSAELFFRAVQELLSLKSA